jgi:hypothetical protein
MKGRCCMADGMYRKAKKSAEQQRAQNIKDVGSSEPWTWEDEDDDE